MDFSFNTTERQAAAVLGVSLETLKKMRLRGEVPNYIYTKFGYKRLRYCLALLQDWQLDPNDLEAQTRAFQQLQNSRISNLPQKSGRK